MAWITTVVEGLLSHRNFARFADLMDSVLRREGVSSARSFLERSKDVWLPLLQAMQRTGGPTHSEHARPDQMLRRDQRVQGAVMDEGLAICSGRWQLVWERPPQQLTQECSLGQLVS